MKRTYLHFLTVLFLFNTSCEEDVYTGTVESEYFENGKLFVESKPSGAQIFVDNKNSSLSTPDTIKWLKSGMHSITLKKYLFQDTVLAVQVRDKEVNSLFVDFTLNSKNFGKIECKSEPPGSDIYLNDSLTSKKTPSVLPYLYPGNYKIKYSHENHRDDSTTVLVKSNEITKVSITLEDTSKWVSYNMSNSQILSEFLTTVVHDKNNHIWIGSGRGLGCFDGKNWKIYTTSNTPIRTDVISCIAVDNENKKWIGTPNGLYVFDDRDWAVFSSNLPSQNITTIIFDKSGNAWIATDKGLAKYDQTSLKVFTTSNSGLKGNEITYLFIDSNDKLWIGTMYNGISVYDGSNWIYFDNSNMKVGNYSLSGLIKTISEDINGKIWVSLIGSYGWGDLAYFDGNSWHSYRNQYLTFNGVYSLYNYVDKIIVGTRNGLGILNSNYSFEFSSEGNYRLDHLRTESVTIDSQGNLWLATFGNGLAKLKKGNF